MPAATAKPLPTPEQLKTYADQLPDIYRDVLSAFANANPRRKYGGDLAYETVLANVLNGARTAGAGSRYEPEEVSVAIERLVESGLLEAARVGYGGIEDLRPAPVGEELVAVLTGRRAERLNVPDLPPPTW